MTSTFEPALVVDLAAPDGPTQTTVPLTDAEITARQADAAAELKAQQKRALAEIVFRRDRYLAQTDWLTLPSTSLPTDLPATIVSDIDANHDAWVTYRQQLRDYPASVTDPLNPPPFPVQPAAPAVKLT